MKYIIKFTAQLIAFILIMLFWFYPYLIWNAEKHDDHNDIIEDFSYCYERFKRRFVKPRNAL
jgi:hypothetical protein